MITVTIIFLFLSFMGLYRRKDFIVEGNEEGDTEWEKKDLVDFYYGNVTFPKDRFPVADNYMPSLHRCISVGEAFGGAYLVNSKFVLQRKTDYDLKTAFGEMASFIIYRFRDNPFKDIEGTLMQSMDVLDFSVIHLSPYERLIERYSATLSATNKSRLDLSEIRYATQYIKSQTMQLLTKGMVSTRMKIEYQQTVVLIPFLGNHQGDGHSAIQNRRMYLQACFWSFYLYYEHIVIGVALQEDEEYIRYESGLPFMDIIYVPTLTKHGALPVALVHEAKLRLASKQWSFQYIFFTEADHILLMRIADDLYEYISKFPTRIVVPHRLTSYPSSVIEQVHHRNDRYTPLPLVSTVSTETATNITSTSSPLTSEDTPYQLWEEYPWQCCEERQYCVHRRDWISIQNTSIPVMSIYGLNVAIGNCNFHTEYYRQCTVYPITTPSNPIDSSAPARRSSICYH